MDQLVEVRLLATERHAKHVATEKAKPLPPKTTSPSIVGALYTKDDLWYIKRNGVATRIEDMAVIAGPYSPEKRPLSEFGRSYHAGWVTALDRNFYCINNDTFVLPLGEIHNE